MNTLVLGFGREMLGRWGLWILLGAIFVASRASFDSTLGDATIGPYLAYASLWPIALLFRCAWLVQKRRCQGWPLEEQLRDPNGYRAPLAEVFATLLLMVVGFGLVGLATALPGMRIPSANSSLHPARLLPTDDGTWSFDLHGPAPKGSALLLTLDWSAYRGESTALPISSAEEMQHMASGNEAERVASAGEILRWPLTATQAQTGQVLLHPPVDSKLRVFNSLVRLEVPRPGRDQLWLLLGRQLLFFAPLITLLLALTRFGRTDANLAAWAVFFFGSLAAYHPPSHLADANLGLLAKLLLWSKQVLPPVDGLISSGYRFERFAGTTAIGATLLWLTIGLLGLMLACKRRAPQ